jgi:cardiolipin synthase
MRPHWLIKHMYHYDTQVSLLLSGRAYFDALLALIEHATDSVHMQFYIFDEDQTGKQVINALLRAAKRGVRVCLVVDGYASSKITKETVALLRQNGIYFKYFSPIKTFYLRVGRRMHHKIVVVDGTEALVGGINIADKYAGIDAPHAWLDFAVKLQGSVVQDIVQMVHTYIPKKHRTTKVREINSGNVAVRLLQNDWRRGYIEISASYRQAIRQSKHELIIVASYFFPSNSMLRLLKKARQRGVRIVFFTGSSSDVIILGSAIRYLYDWMLRNGIEIYEWQPSVMHGKVLIKDGEEVNIGSYNLNALSDFGSTEANIHLLDNAFANQVKSILNNEITTSSKRIDRYYFSKTVTPLRRLLRWISYHLFRVALKLLFVLMQRSRF